jgi:hypothetical protein
MKKENNNLYNVMTQLIQEQKSLWRIKNMYVKDAGTDKDIKLFWNELAKDKEEAIKILKEIVKSELNKSK